VKQRLYTLAKQTLVYGVSAAALQIVGVITLPVFARTFSPAEYGVLEIATAGLGAMLVIADLGMASASQRSYFDYSDADVPERRAVLATALATSLATAGALAALLIVFRGPIADWLLHSREHVEVVVLVALCLPVAVLALLLREVMRLRFMAWRYSWSAIAGAVVAAALGIGLVLATDLGVEGVLIGVLAGHVVAVLVGLPGVVRHIGRRLSRRELRVMLAFGLPLLPAAAAMWGLAFLDRVLLSRLADLDEVGQYAVGARFALVLMLVVTAFGLAYNPYMLSMFAEDREAEKQVRGRTLTYLTILLTAVSLALALFAREIATVVAPDFTQAYEVVGILCLGVAVFGVSTVAMAGIALVRKTRYYAVYSLAALVFNVALCFALIPPLGAVGAAFAAAGGYALLTALYYHRSQRLYPTPYEPRKVLAVLALGAAFVPLGLLPLGPAYVALKLAGMVAFVGALVALRVIGALELQELKSLAARVTRRPQATPGV
jgi:O-antigen/teichoic acid export membrane protein